MIIPKQNKRNREKWVEVQLYLYREVREGLTGKMAGNVWDSYLLEISAPPSDHRGEASEPCLKEPRSLIASQSSQPILADTELEKGKREKWSENCKESCPRN